LIEDFCELFSLLFVILQLFYISILYCCAPDIELSVECDISSDTGSV